MSITNPGYQYEQLETSIDAIRILKLLPSTLDGVIVCSLTNVRLKDATYTALSYMWEPNRPEYESKSATSERCIILLDQVEHEVGRNLWHFLRAARNSSFATNLWIDALCIDQNNVEERNKQVSMMGQIYSQAESVVLWLGPGSDATRVFFNLLPGLQHGEVTADNAIAGRITQNELCQFITGYHEVSTNQYWHRAWILQEVSLAKEVIIKYGTDEMSWDLFRSCMMSLFKEMSTVFDPLFQRFGLQRYTRLDRKAVFEVMQSRSGGYRQRHSLCSIVRKNFSRQCKLVHDRIYSVVSLASDGSAIDVNYNWKPAELWEHIVGMIGNGIFRHGVYLLNTLELLAKDILQTASQEFLNSRLQIDLRPVEIQYVVRSSGLAAESYWNETKTTYVTESELYLCSCQFCRHDKSVASKGSMIVRLPGGMIKLLFQEDRSGSSSVDFKPVGCVVDSLEGDAMLNSSYDPDVLEAKGFGILVVDPDMLNEIGGISVERSNNRTQYSLKASKEPNARLSLARKDLISIWKYRHYDRDLLGDAQHGFGEWKHKTTRDANARASFFAVAYDHDNTFTQTDNLKQEI